MQITECYATSIIKNTKKFCKPEINMVIEKCNKT